MFVQRSMLLQRSNVNLDDVIGVAVDVGLSFPFLLLVMAVAASFEKANIWTILLTLGLTSWLGIARVIRAKTLEIRSREFVVAAQALGQSTPRILVTHILPNVRGALVAIATLSVGPMIVAESVLSYLGVGLAPPTPTWGHMLQEGQEVLSSAPWLFFAPSVLILLTTLGFNMLGEGLRSSDAR
jgi:peptide/nickel transport system permease protein